MSNFNFMEIFKKAWEITWKNKRLWFFGILLALTSLGSSFDLPNGDKDAPKNLETVKSFLTENWHISAMIIIFGAMVIIAIVVFGTLARAGLIESVGKIQKEEPWSFKQGILSGKKYFWKIIGLGLLISFSILAILIILAVPVVLLFVNKSFLIAIPLAILACIILLGVLIFATYIRLFGHIYIVLGKLKIYASIENAYHLFIKNWSNSIITGLLFIPVNILMGIAILLTVLAGIVIFFPLGILLFAILKDTGIVLTLILGIPILLTALLFISSVKQVFSQTVWVLFFEEIAKPKKEETVSERLEEKTPEVIQAVPLGGTTHSETE